MPATVTIDDVLRYQNLVWAVREPLERAHLVTKYRTAEDDEIDAKCGTYGAWQTIALIPQQQFCSSCIRWAERQAERRQESEGYSG